MKLILEDPIMQSGILKCHARHLVNQYGEFIEGYRPCLLPAYGGAFHTRYFKKLNNSNISSVITVYDFVYERFMRGPAKWIHLTQKYSAIRLIQSNIRIY